MADNTFFTKRHYDSRLFTDGSWAIIIDEPRAYLAHECSLYAAKWIDPIYIYRIPETASIPCGYCKERAPDRIQTIFRLYAE